MGNPLYPSLHQVNTRGQLTERSRALGRPATLARPVREHLRAGLDYQGRCARFLENHDEPRAAATFPTPTHEAAAVVTYLTPGLRSYHAFAVGAA